MSTSTPRSEERSRELAALLARVSLGDRAAFATLYRETSSHLLGVVLRIHRERAQAEDVLQEVYVNVWRAAQSFDGRLSQPLTWLTSIARNRAIDALRRHRTQPTTVSTTASGADDDDHDMLHNFASDAPGPTDLLEQAVQARALKQCLGALSGEQQQCVALAFYQGLSHAEVAAHLRQPLGSVKSWVRRGLLALKSCLDRLGIEGAR